MKLIRALVAKVRNAARLIGERGPRRHGAAVLRRYVPAQAAWIEAGYSRLSADASYLIWRKLHPGKKVVFVTFADGILFSSARLAKEVSALGVFDEIICYDPSMLSNEFIARHKEHLTHSRGFGYWSWKPHVILQTLDATAWGDIVVYADAGCTAEASSAHLLKRLVMELDMSEDGLMVTENPYSEFVTREWTKADLLDHFGFLGNEQVLESRQVEAGRVALAKTEKNMQLVQAWADTAATLHLIGDSPSVAANDARFIEHRHDQSIFSLLLQKRAFITGLEQVFRATRLSNKP